MYVMPEWKKNIQKGWNTQIPNARQLKMFSAGFIYILTKFILSPFDMLMDGWMDEWLVSIGWISFWIWRVSFHVPQCFVLVGFFLFSFNHCLFAYIYVFITIYEMKKKHTYLFSIIEMRCFILIFLEFVLYCYVFFFFLVFSFISPSLHFGVRKFIFFFPPFAYYHYLLSSLSITNVFFCPPLRRRGFQYFCCACGSGSCPYISSNTKKYEPDVCT